MYSIYVDAVLNHMTGGGNGTGSDNSSFDGEAQSYPRVPYQNSDFHGHNECPSTDLNIHVRSHALSLYLIVVNRYLHRIILYLRAY